MCSARLPKSARGTRGTARTLLPALGRLGLLSRRASQPTVPVSGGMVEVQARLLVPHGVCASGPGIAGAAGPTRTGRPHRHRLSQHIRRHDSDRAHGLPEAETALLVRQRGRPPDIPAGQRGVVDRLHQQYEPPAVGSPNLAHRPLSHAVPSRRCAQWATSVPNGRPSSCGTKVAHNVERYLNRVGPRSFRRPLGYRSTLGGVLRRECVDREPRDRNNGSSRRHRWHTVSSETPNSGAVLRFGVPRGRAVLRTVCIDS